MFLGDYMTKVETAKQALEIANEFLKAAGITFHSITKVIPQGDMWIVEARAFGGNFMLKIDKESGEVIEYTGA